MLRIKLIDKKVYEDEELKEIIEFKKIEGLYMSGIENEDVIEKDNIKGIKMSVKLVSFEQDRVYIDNISGIKNEEGIWIESKFGGF